MSEQNQTTAEADDRAENELDILACDWLVHLLWEHYPEALPTWTDTPLHIRQHLVLMARKIREAVSDGRKI
jgi:hypothetical protein